MPSRAMPDAAVRRRSCNRHEDMSAGSSASRRRLFFEYALDGAMPFVVKTKGDPTIRGAPFRTAIVEFDAFIGVGFPLIEWLLRLSVLHARTGCAGIPAIWVSLWLRLKRRAHSPVGTQSWRNLSFLFGALGGLGTESATDKPMNGRPDATVFVTAR